ncbi:MAG: hypothetical protein AB8F94_09730 [Saprospiraceae bacterium]
MKFELLLFLLLANCNIFSQTKIPDYELEYTDHSGGREAFVIEFYLKNYTEDTLFIHRSVPLKYQTRSGFSVPFAPEFYSMKFLTDVTFCETAPYFMDGGSAKPVKDETYFLAIPPKGQYQINYYNSTMNQMICDEKVGEVKVKFKYDFDERYLDKAFFAKEITEAGKLSKEKSEALYQLLQKSYRGKIESEEITIDLNNIKKNGTDEVKKSRAIRKAKRMYGIEISNIFLPDHLNLYPRIDVNVGEEFKEKDLEQMQRNLMNSFFDRNQTYTVVKKNNEIEWLVGSSYMKESPVFIYDYKTVLDSAEMTIQLLTDQKETSEIKDYEIHSIYLPMQNIGASTQRFIDKRVLLILKDKEGNFFSMGFRKFPISRRQVKPITKVDESFVEIKKSYSSMIDDQYYVYKILENGDLVFGKKDYVNRGLGNYQGYFIKLK